MSDAVDTDGLVAKILAGLKSASASGRDDDHDVDDFSGRRVPVDRLRREIDKRKALESSLSDLTAQLDQLQGAYKTQVDALKSEAADSVKALQMRHQEDMGLADMGLRDGLSRKAARDAYDALPKAQRPPSVQEWWQGTREAHSAHLADPKKVEAPSVPGTLTSFLPQPEKGASRAQVTIPTAPGPAPTNGAAPQADTLQGWFAALAAQEAGQQG